MNNQKDSQQKPQNPMPPSYPYSVQPPDDEINLLDLWKVLVEQKMLIFLFTTIATVVALVYALLATPIYRAEALLAPVINEKGGRLSALDGQFGGLASLAGINLGGGGSSVDVAIATLKSRDFTNRFIEDENLMPVLFEAQWDENNKQWINIEKPPTLWKAYKIFKSILAISQDNKTGLITLAIDWKDPVLAAEWLGKLVARVNNKLRQEAIMESEKSIKYLETELQKTSVIEIKESIYNLIEAQTKTKMLANTQEEYAFRVLDSAVVPEEKFKPKRTLIVVLGFIIGGMMGVFLAFIRRAFTESK
jgi:uncharacterized protein involved in exopolysaccharide biosynthesis